MASKAGSREAARQLQNDSKRLCTVQKAQTKRSLVVEKEDLVTILDVEGEDPLTRVLRP